MEFQSFGQWLRHRRKALDLTREGLAYRVACSAATIRKIEAEERRPSVQIAERLADIFNIPLSERESFISFARGDWQSAPQEMIEDPPWHAPKKSPRSNIPSSITSFIGREADLVLVRGYLSNADIRLITLIGPPGIGKTRLSLEAARSSLSNFRDGVFFVALAPLDNPALIASTILQTLGYAEAKNLPADKQLLIGIGDKQILLVLDNCEHLIEDMAPLVSDLLTACSRLKILATSREALRIPGEWIYSVPTLNTPKADLPVDFRTVSEFPSLKLFAERARAVRSDFSLDADNLQAVVSICAQLDGLPLAIELIAARIRLMSPQTLLERLSDFVLSADGMRAISARQKTLNNAIGWSYDFLAEEEQKAFACLSVFSGGFTLEDAEAILEDFIIDQSISNLINSLVDKSLLQRTSGARDFIRYQMLVTIQKYALDKLQNKGLEAGARDRHLAFFLDLAKRGEEEIHGPAQIEWIERLEREYDNFRTALDWSVSRQNTESALRLISALSWHWGQWHHNSEMRGWFDRIRTLPNVSAFPALYAQLLNHIGHSSWLAGEFHHARTVLEEGIALWKTLGASGERGLADASCFLGMVAHSIDSDYGTAHSLFEQSLGLYKNCGDSWGMAFAFFNLGWVDDHRNQDDSAQRMLEQSLELFSQLGDLWGMGRSSRLLGQLFLKQGIYEKARIYFDQHLSIDEKLQFRPGIVIALGNLGDLHRHQEEYARAEQHYHASLDMCREYGLKIDRGYNYFALGMLGLQKKDYAFARKYILQYFDSGSSVSRTLAALDLCFGLAAVAGGINQPERSARLFGAAQTLLKVIDIPYTPFDRAIFDRHIQTAREQLDEARFEALQAEGRTMTTEQAIEYALEMN